MKQLEEYYRIKTEEINQQIEEEEDKRKSLISMDYEETDMSSIFSSLMDTNDEYKELKAENIQLEVDYNDTLDDLKRIQEQRMREYEKLQLDFNQLQNEFENKEDVVNQVVENNVSLQFELLTYRNLLNSEEKRINRSQHDLQSATPPASPTTPEIPKDFSVQKVAVKKSTTGFPLFIFLLIIISFCL